MREEAPQEGHDWQGQRLALVSVSIVFVAEGHVSIGQTHDAPIGDRHTVGIARQITHHLHRSTEGRLGVHDPFMTSGSGQAAGKDTRAARLVQLTITGGTCKQIQALASKDAAQHSHG